MESVASVINFDIFAISSISTSSVNGLAIVMQKKLPNPMRREFPLPQRGRQLKIFLVQDVQKIVHSCQSSLDGCSRGKMNLDLISFSDLAWAKCSINFPSAVTISDRKIAFKKPLTLAIAFNISLLFVNYQLHYYPILSPWEGNLIIS